MACACCTPAYSGEGFEPFIDTNSLVERCRLDNSRTNFKKPMVRPENQPSLLQKLPIEVYHNCLRHLDVGTLTSMRAVSQYTRATIDSLLLYKELYLFARPAIRACLSSGIAHHIPLLRLHDALTTPECYYCKQTLVSLLNVEAIHDKSLLYRESPESVFGNYLSLYECRRICAFCARNSPLLKPVELTHLIKLCAQRRSALAANSLRFIPNLKTIPGRYTPDPTSRIPRATILLAKSIPLDPSKPLNGQETRLLSTDDTADDVKINHHPFARAADESDISHSAHYVSTETERLITLRYTTCISLPYLTTSKKLENGVLCTECNLNMRFLDCQWKEIQRHRRHFNPVVSTRRRNLINSARKAASKFYILNPETVEEKELSVQEHYRLEHMDSTSEMSKEEMEWRAQHKGPALSVLSEKHFWHPPESESEKKNTKVVSASAK